MYRLDEGVVGSGKGLSLIVGHWLKILPQNSNQPNMCTVYMYCVRCTLFPPADEICARLAGNFCQ
jgi:hypothetical protein